MHYFHGVSRMDIILFNDILLPFDNFISKFVNNGVLYFFPSLYLFILVFFSEILFPSMLFKIMYIISVKKKLYLWKGILMLKFIQLFLIEPLFSPFSCFFMCIFSILCNVEFYYNYFIYDDCIICFEKKFNGIISQCCPYVRICHSCNKKIARCPICRN